MVAKTFAELSGTAKAIEILRWIGVLPAAVLGRFAYGTILAAIYRVKAVPGGVLPDTSALGHWLQLLIFYPPPIAIFVVAGAMMAPRRRLATAVVLAAPAIALSLTIHVLLPDHVGVNNYKHFTAETTGAIIATILVFYWQGRRRKQINQEEQTATVGRERVWRSFVKLKN